MLRMFTPPPLQSFSWRPLKRTAINLSQCPPLERTPCGPLQSFLGDGNDCGISQSFSPLPPSQSFSSGNLSQLVREGGLRKQRADTNQNAAATRSFSDSRLMRPALMCGRECSWRTGRLTWPRKNDTMGFPHSWVKCSLTLKNRRLRNGTYILDSICKVFLPVEASEAKSRSQNPQKRITIKKPLKACKVQGLERLEG